MMLTALLLTPLVAIALIGLLPRAAAARWLTLAALLTQLVIALVLAALFDSSQGGFQFVEKYAWMPGLNIHYHLGVDGFSLLFLPATALLAGGVLITSWHAMQGRPRLYCSLLLLLEMASIGVFCALDTILFYLFWELTLAPLFFLVSVFGCGPGRRHAAVKYVMVMLAGGVALLFGFLVLAFAAAEVAGGGLVFDLPLLLQTSLDIDTQILVLLLLLLGFAVKTPLLPLHSWLPLMAMEGPPAVIAMITGLKLGAWGLLRFAAPLAPQAAQQLHWLLAGLAVATLIYGAFAALAQSNLRRMLAYASMSHVGLVVLGIASFNQQGAEGAVLQLLTFTLAAGGLFLLTAQLHQRTGVTEVAGLGGAAAAMPQLAALMLFFGLISIGLPGGSGFIAELLIIISTFDHHAGAGLAALAVTILGAAAFISLYRRIFQGPPQRDIVRQAQDLQPRELAIALIFAAPLLLFGLWPAPIFNILRPAAIAWLAAFS